MCAYASLFFRALCSATWKLSRDPETTSRTSVRQWGIANSMERHFPINKLSTLITPVIVRELRHSDYLGPSHLWNLGSPYLRKYHQRTGCQSAAQKMMQLHKRTYIPFVLYMVRRVVIPEGILPRVLGIGDNKPHSVSQSLEVLVAPATVDRRA